MTRQSIQLTEKPLAESSLARTQSQVSQVGLRLRVAHKDLQRALEKTVPTSRSDQGRQKICKKVLGLKVCSRVSWTYQLTRLGDVALQAIDDEIEVAFPFEFAGTAGLSGDLARMLGLSSVEFDGAMQLQTRTSFDLAHNWCPDVSTDVTYQWLRKPRVEWGSGLDFSVTKLLDKQLQKELAGVDERLAELIDCQRIRHDLQQVWGNYSQPLAIDLNIADNAAALVSTSSASELPDSSDSSAWLAASVDAPGLYLNIAPLAAAFSGVVNDGGAIGMTVQVKARISVDGEALAPAEGGAIDSLTPFKDGSDGKLENHLAGQASEAATALLNPQSLPLGDAAAQTRAANAAVDAVGRQADASREEALAVSSNLPALERIDYEIGDTRFSLLLRLPYQLLVARAAAEIVGQTFDSQTAAGKVSVTLKDLDIYPAGDKLALALSIAADLPTSRTATEGQIYLTARPTVDEGGQLLTFTDLEVAPVLDSTVWQVIANLFERTIVRRLQQQAVVDLAPRFRELETELLAQLADKDRTSGVIVRAQDLQLRLGSVVAEPNAVALVLQASSQLDVELPYELFEL